ncbi:SDR family NAD(P)-dependent oxidoreductase [Streptomyces sp. MS1.HAVA.3]|uniref:SDR family NAD(P)-dependent oxidoreductase n=1 Tax=Streptomyces caledonius TaxID=3134107 RepID=A0ABU8UFN4_9ACTN
MELKNAVAVVTGANRGLGRHLAAQLVERGAKVYATARRPETVDLPGVVPLQLDVTDEESVRAAARTASDATLLVNNAGILTDTPLVAGGLDAVRLEMETNFFGPLAVTRAFAPSSRATAAAPCSTSCRSCPGCTRPASGPTPRRRPRPGP